MRINRSADFRSEAPFASLNAFPWWSVHRKKIFCRRLRNGADIWITSTFLKNSRQLWEFLRKPIVINEYKKGNIKPIFASEWYCLFSFSVPSSAYWPACFQGRFRTPWRARQECGQNRTTEFNRDLTIESINRLKLKQQVPFLKSFPWRRLLRRSWKAK